MSKKAYVKNMGRGVEHVVSVEVGGRTVALVPQHLTEVSEDEAKVIQFNYAHMGVHYVSEEEAKTCGIPIAAPPPPPVEAPIADLTVGRNPKGSRARSADRACE